MARVLLFLIPILTLVIPQRLFGYYATIIGTLGVCVIIMITLLSDASKEAFAEFGIEVTLVYILFNFVLLGIRHTFIRRARARIPKLPAPKE